MDGLVIIGIALLIFSLAAGFVNSAIIVVLDADKLKAFGAAAFVLSMMAAAIYFSRGYIG